MLSGSDQVLVLIVQFILSNLNIFLSDLLVINKIDIAHLVNTDLDVNLEMLKKMRGMDLFVFARAEDCYNTETIVEHLLKARDEALNTYLGYHWTWVNILNVIASARLR